MASQVYSMALSLIVGIFTARFLGPSNYGVIGYGQSMVTLFTSISTLGMASIVIKDLVSEPERKGEILGSALGLRLISSSFCILFIDLLVTVVEPDNTVLRTVTLLQSVALFFNAFDTLGLWFEARLENKYVAIGTIVAHTLMTIWRISLLIKGASVEWFAASTCILNFSSNLIVCVLFFKNSKDGISFSLATAKKLFSRSYHFIFSGLAITLYTQIDKIMLGSMLSETQVGYYNVATTLANAWEFVPLAVISSASILIFEAKEYNEDLYLKRLSVLLSGITVMGVAVAIFFSFTGKLFITQLYGEAYSDSVLPFIIIIWSTCAAVLGSARGSTWIVAENYNRYSKYYVFISAAVNIILNWLWIQKYGCLGAAFATLVSQFVNVFIAPLFFKQTRCFLHIYVKAWPITMGFISDKAGYFRRERKNG